MCSIGGFIDFSKNCSNNTISMMMQTQLHRGPDGNQHFLHNHSHYNLAFGHNRLSIIDLNENANQPMHDNHLHIVFNGEIYNYKTIRNELIKQGFQFKTNSDTEVILKAYQHFGQECLHHFRGMFAFVIFDEKKQSLFGARDRVGAKPFYYQVANNYFVFGSELKVLMQFPLFEKKISLQALGDLLNYSFIPAPKCIFENTFKLEAGHSFQYDLSQQKINISRYWSVNNAYLLPKKNINYQDAMQKTESILEESFQLRMVADVPVGVFLSGGYDSTCVAALLQKNSDAKINTFTIGVENKQLNEAPFAKQTAQILGTQHHETYCTLKEAENLIDELPYFYDEPFGDSSAIPTMLVSKIAAKHIKVVLSADGGDEIFAGYNRYDYVETIRKISKIPEFAKQSLASILSRFSPKSFPWFNEHPLFAQRFPKFINLLKNSDIHTLMHVLNSQYSDNEFNKLILNKTKPSLDAFVHPQLKNISALSYMMCIDYQTYMQDDIMHKVDRATMSASIEGREPFLDQNIIEFVATLPDDYKWEKGNKKKILKDIVHQYIPKEKMNRPKMGFAIPVTNWLKTTWQNRVNHYLSEEKLNSHELLNTKYIHQIIKEFNAGRTDHTVKIWNLLVFQMWYERYMQ
jgi:asparagine synthase (glutamine-hydrolysing)